MHNARPAQRRRRRPDREAAGTAARQGGDSAERARRASAGLRGIVRAVYSTHILQPSSDRGHRSTP